MDPILMVSVKVATLCFLKIKVFWNKGYQVIIFAKPHFWRVALFQVQKFGTDTRFGLAVLHQCGKRVETKSQKVFGANSYIGRSYSGKLVGDPFCPLLPSWIGLIIEWVGNFPDI